MIELAVAGVATMAALSGAASALILHPGSPLGAPLRRISCGAVALTFDDGPDPEWTPRVLDRLDRVGAKASFFVLGTQLKQFPELVRACAARGHKVEIHGMGHRVATLQWPSALGAELASMIGEIEALTGRPPRWYRPPFGARPLSSRPLGKLGLVTWSWSCGDWANGASDDQPMPGVSAGDIVLLHDGPTPERGPRARTLAALTSLAATGRALVSLPDGMV